MIFINYIGNPDTVADEIANGSFEYAGLRVSFNCHSAFELHGDPVSDYGTVCAVAAHFGYDSFSFSFDIFRSKLPEETQEAMLAAHSNVRDLNSVEATYYEALRHVVAMRPGELYEVDGNYIERHELLGNDDPLTTAPSYSVRTRSSSGGSYSARSALYAVGVTPPLYVGNGVTINLHSDRVPATVVSVSPSGKTVTIQRDDYRVVSGSSFDGSAEYECSPNPDGRTETVRIRKDGRYYPAGSGTRGLSFGRSAYRDPSF